MNNENNHIAPHDLIGKYLSGQAGTDEITQLEDWVKDNPENRKAFLNYKLLWIKSGFVKKDTSIQLAAEWEKLEHRLFPDENKVKPLYPSSGKGIYKLIFRYAAVFIAILTLSGVLYLLLSQSKMEESIALNSILTLQLPDGSDVTLNKGSRLIYPSAFKGDNRSVRLEGDGFFHVKPDPSKVFIVEAGQSTVKVLGTSFYLNAKAGQPEIEVTVNSGKVSFSSDSKEIILIAGEKGTLNKESGTLNKMANQDVNFLSWKTRKLVFRDTRLETVFNKIEEIYGTTVRTASPHILECRLTATFDNLSLEEVLEILKTTFDLEAEKQNDMIIVSGNGCN